MPAIEIYKVDHEALIRDKDACRRLHVFCSDNHIREQTPNSDTLDYQEFCDKFLVNTDMVGVVMHDEDAIDKPIIATIFAFPVDFGSEYFRLTDQVPDGIYYFVYGFGSITNDMRTIIDLYRNLLAQIRADYLVGFVWDTSKIGRRKFYEKIGAKRVETDQINLRGGAYYYLVTDPLLKRG